MANFKKIYVDDWAGTFASAYAYKQFDAKILVRSARALDLYADNFVLGGKDFSDQAEGTVHVHPPIGEEGLKKIAAEPCTSQIILYLDVEGQQQEYIRNSKGDIICVYGDDAQMEQAMALLRKISDGVVS